MEYKLGDKVKFIKYGNEFKWEESYGLEIGDVVEVTKGNQEVIWVLSKSGFMVYIGTDQVEPVTVKTDTNNQQTASGIKPVKSNETSLYSPLTVQQSGDHYSKKGIQPIEYGLANDLSFPQVNIVKYITRHEDKNGLDDLAKSIHYHFFEALRCYGEEGSDELRNKVLKLLNIDKDVNDE